MKTNWIYRRAPWLLTALVLALLVPGTGLLPLIDRDEPRFATATREMILRGDWVVPTFNGQERFDKPALTYWLMRAGYSVFGFNEFGARVQAILATLCLVLLVWWAGRRWFGEPVGLAAGAMLASALQVFIHGRLAVADMPMVVCVALVCIGIKELLDGEPGPFYRQRWWWFVYLGLGVGFLAKGPIAWAVPALGLLIFRFLLWRKPVAWSRLGIGPGIFLSLLVVAAWGIPALSMTDGRFWKVGMGEHVLQRGFERFNGRGYSPFFYVSTAPFSLFPWIIFAAFVPWIVARAWSERTAWLLAWALAPYIIFTAYATQLPHYVLPAFPALFLLLAQALGADRDLWPKSAVRFAWAAVAFLSCLLTVALVVVIKAQLPTEIEAIRHALIGVFMILGGLIFAAVETLLGRARFAVFGLLAIIPGTLLAARELRNCSLTAESGQWGRGLPNDTRCVGAGFSEPSLVFYSSRHWDFPQNADELRKTLATPGPLVIATLMDEADPLDFFRAGLSDELRRTKPVRWRPGSPEVAEVLKAAGADRWPSREVDGFNLGRTRWQRVKIFKRAEAD